MPLHCNVNACTLPPASLLRKYVDQGAYTDCYVVQLATDVTQAQYVEAFYTTPAFKLERLILSWLVAKPSSDAEVRQLASGQVDSFAAWNVEARRSDQLLLCDFQNRTRSWLMTAPVDSGTFLYFGSAVVPARTRSGETRMGSMFQALLVFHKLYSQVLLRAARSRLMKQRVAGNIGG
jgi:hypothetical protein